MSVAVHEVSNYGRCNITRVYKTVHNEIAVRLEQKSGGDEAVFVLGPADIETLTYQLELITNERNK